MQQLKRIGVTVKLEMVTADVSRYAAFMKDKQMSNSSQGGLNNPDSALIQSYLCESQKNMSAYCDQEVDKMWRDFKRTFNQDEAVKILDKIQQRLLDDMVFAPTIRTTSYHLTYNYVHGKRDQFYDAGWAHGYQYANVWMDK